MQSTFNGITILSASKQLNTEISTLLKDLKYAISQLKAIGLASSIQMIFNDTIEINQISNDGKLNLCHLFGLIFIYGLNVELTHISKLPQKSKTDEGNKYDIDVNILQLFEQQNQNNKHQICHQLLHQIEICKQQSPILLFYGDGDLNANKSDSVTVAKNITLNTHNCNKSKFNLNSMSLNIAMMNNKIWSECKLNSFDNPSKSTKITLLSSSKIIENKNAKTTPRSKSKSENGKNPKVSYMKIPKSKLSPYHDKNYHQYGKQYKLPTYPLQEIAKHNTKDSCWIIVNGLVLDVTYFLPYHPASQQSIIKYGGKNCDRHFKFHSKNAQKIFWKFVIGRVEKENECIIQ